LSFPFLIIFLILLFALLLTHSPSLYSSFLLLRSFSPFQYISHSSFCITFFYLIPHSNICFFPPFFISSS
jgi:hypothetical protein